MFVMFTLRDVIHRVEIHARWELNLWLSQVSFGRGFCSRIEDLDLVILKQQPWQQMWKKHVQDAGFRLAS